MKMSAFMKLSSGDVSKLIESLGYQQYTAISGHICDLLEVKDPHWIQSIALPPVEPRRLFLEEKSRTGSTADSFTYIQYLKERGLDEYT